MFRGFLLAVALSAPARAQPDDPLQSFLVQSACLDAAGRPEPGVTPFDAACTRRRPQRQDLPMPYRRHDWPALQHARAQPEGYQASDSVIGSLTGQPAAVQTFDFGAGDGRRFGVLDRGRGDGGQVIPLGPGPAFIVMTEDGGGGVQWFLSPDCQEGGRGWQGWLLAGPRPGSEWMQRVVRLRIAHTAQACPRAFDASLTRWRRLRLPLPWREAATGRTGQVPVEAVVSEHYGGATIEGAHHLERFLLAEDLGLVRWERWENPRLSRLPDLAGRADTMARQQRCPPIETSLPPGPGWAMVDCRMWTNIVRAAPGRPLAALPWPPPELR